MWTVHEDQQSPPDLTAPWVLPAGAAGVPLARQAARETAQGIGVSDAATLDTIELLVSELTSNAVKHTAGSATLRVVRLGEIIRIEVCDTEPASAPVEQQIDLAAQSGRGLLLVSTLATSWGYDRIADQKCTWAELDLTPQ